MPNPDETPPIDLYGLPTVQDETYWERFHAAGLNQPDPDPVTATNGAGAFQWVDLTHPDYATPPDPPNVQGLLYAARRHVISGPPESTKTLIAYMLLLEALRAGHGIAILDFEMGPHAAVTLLRELGATTEELQQIQYTEPDRPPTPADIARIVGLGTGYTLIDAAAGAYDTSGLDDNSRKDAETFAAQWIRPLWQAGVATIVIDHVTKDTQTRGKFAIGSERKTGQADVHLSLEALKPLHRGSTGLVKIHVHKDRPGHLPRPTAYIVDLTSDHEHHITWTLREPLQTTEDGFRHTIYMERISRHMEKQPDHHFTKNELETDVQGRAELVRTALLEMVEDGYVTVVETHLKYPKFTLVRPFVPSSSHVVPDEVVPPRPNSSPPYRGTTDGTDEPDDPKTQNVVPPEIDVYDPNLQALLDDNIPF